MVGDNILRLNSPARQPETASPNFISRIVAAISRQLSRMWCAMHGHLILLHYEPNKLSLQCALCGYESEGWDVGRPLAARRPLERAARMDKSLHPHLVRTERRRTLRAVPSGARLAS
jgi:hypothetical protein